MKKIKYLKKSLSNKEEVLGIAELHWINYTLPIFLLVFSTMSLRYPIILAVILLFAIIAFLNVLTTEMIVTDKRVICKTGIISIRTNELRNQKVESIKIQQSFLGRFLGYGDLLLTGTGGSHVLLRRIKNVQMTKSNFEDIIEKNLK